MDDASITANEDQPTPLDSASRQGEIDNEIKWIRRLRRILGHGVKDNPRLPRLTMKHLEALSAYLVELVRGRLLPPETAEDASRLKAARDRLWEYDCVDREAHQRGTHIGFIRSFQETVGLPPAPAEELRRLTLAQLQAREAEVVRSVSERLLPLTAGEEASAGGGTGEGIPHKAGNAQ